MIRYGTHDQSPENVSPVSSCSARSARHREEHDAEAEEQRADDPEGDVPAELLQRDEGLLLEVRDDHVA